MGKLVFITGKPTTRPRDAITTRPILQGLYSIDAIWIQDIYAIMNSTVNIYLRFVYFLVFAAGFRFRWPTVHFCVRTPRKT